MKTETKKRIWDEVVKQLNNGCAGGKNFALRFSHDHKPLIRIFNGAVWELPDCVIDKLKGNAKKLIEIEKEKSAQESKRTAARLKAEQEEREKRLDEPGFTLLAGEETEILHQGTWRECRENLWKLNRLELPRDPYCGIGCWAIVKGEFEAESGKFDEDIYW